ncbi:MAG TPA: hypothetical protein VK283_12835 [Acidimicrobiales bacterium]|nr:hypothetical protein [Acidimicrobiales bacterium]
MTGTGGGMFSSASGSGAPDRSPAVALGVSLSNVKGRGVSKIVLALIGLVVLPVIIFGFIALTTDAEFFAKLAIAVGIGAILWIAALAAALRLTRGPH